MALVSSTHIASALSRVSVPPALRPGVVAGVPKTAPAPAGPTKPGLAGVDAPSTPNTPATQSPADALAQQKLARELEALQAKMDKLNPALAFVADQESGRTLVQLRDRTTEEVILQFPSETTLQIGRALDRFEKGQLMHRTA